VLEINPQDILSLLSHKRALASLDTLIVQDENTSLLALQKDYTYSPEHYAEQQELKDIVNGYLDQLPPQQRQVLTMRFGLVTGVPMTLEQIGQEFNLTRERIRQIERKALTNIRKIAQR
jgi:RNA polymerase nonessential primary-like sigma factor